MRLISSDWLGYINTGAYGSTLIICLSTSPTCRKSLSVAGVAVDCQFLRESDNIINVFLHFVQVSSIVSVTVWCTSQSHTPHLPVSMCFTKMFQYRDWLHNK